MSQAEDRPRVVFDCMIYLQATANEASPAAACLRLLDQGRIAVFVSPEILREITDVLSRPKVRKTNPHITDESLAELLRRLATKAKLVRRVPRKFKYARDPKDEPYLNLALVAKARYLVSRDNDLLDLMTGYDVESKDFRQRSRPLEILDPITFLNIIRQ